MRDVVFTPIKDGNNWVLNNAVKLSHNSKHNVFGEIFTRYKGTLSLKGTFILSTFHVKQIWTYPDTGFPKLLYKEKKSGF